MKSIIAIALLTWYTIPIHTLIPSTQRISINRFNNRISLPSIQKPNEINALYMISTKVKEELKTSTKNNITNHHATPIGDVSDMIAEEENGSDIDEVVAEVTRLMSDGFDDLVSRSQNISLSIEDKVNALSKENLSSKHQDSLAKTIVEMQEDQERQLFRMQKDAEKKLVGLVEEVAFSDTNLMMDENEIVMGGESWENRSGLVNGALNGLNATELRTRQIMKYWRVAPLYYSVVLLFHWVNKIPGPRTVWLRSTKGIASFFGDSDGRLNKDKYAEYLRNAEQMQMGWKRVGDIASKGSFRRSLEIFRRSLEIWGYFSTFYLREMRMSSKFKKGKWSAEQLAKGRSQLGAEVTQNLLKLGPTFIKVGQLFSTRIDIVPKEYIEQLRLLQDQVPPFSGDISVAILERELGKPIDELFDTFNTTSLAAASLGQVHVATKGDKTFAVKVQRQYLKELFEVDLGQLRQLAGFADAMNLQTEGGLLDRNTQRDWLSVYEESKRLLYEEIDYLNEMKNCDKFRNNFQDLPFIKVPMTYPEFTTDKVMCMEYCPGIKIVDKERIQEVGLDPVDISIKSAQVFLEQLCRHGFFHCDPHPGNVAVDVDENGGAKLVFYDFGMMDSLDKETRKAFVEFLFAFYIEDDVKEVMDALAKLGILREGPDIDRIAVERVGRDFMDRFQSTLQSGSKWDDQLTPEERKQKIRERRKKLGEEFLSLNSDVPFAFPPTWTFVFRAFISLDGIGKTLNPKYDLTRIAQPYMKELLDLKDGSALKTALLRIGKRIGLRPVDINMAITQPRRTAQVQDVTNRLEQGEFKLRVRALEAERMLERSKLFNNNLFNAVISCLFLNSGLCLSSVAATNPVVIPVARSMYVVATVFAAKLPFGIVKLKRFEKYLEKYGVKR